MQPSTTSLNTGAAPTTTQGLPTYLPKAITPGTKAPKKPVDSTLIQISFLYAENYQWIVQEPLAAAQLFTLLPKAVAHAIDVPLEKVIMHSLRPYDTIEKLGYITTQAMTFIPSDKVEQLRLDHQIPTSGLYTNSDPLVSNLTSNINPAIDILPGSTLEGPGNTPDGSSPDGPSGNPNDAFGNGNTGGEQTASQKGTTAAIALGAAGVAGAYGAAMFIIARRYKRRKQRHQRSSSVTSPSEMRQGGSPALVGGALLSRDFTANGGGGGANYGGVGSPHTRDSQGSGRSGMNNSGRTAFISAPVAAENSLGWN